ncbi:hypothetical protein MKX01_036189 [Papaver californicum]|nr:hypothetical protein MKX01_036189 [Papaver californicum]
MTSKTPIFPIPQHPHHFSDYGFDPQMDYLQVLEEAKKHRKEKFLPSTTTTTSRSIESLHFKQQKPISKEEETEDENNYIKNINYRGTISRLVYITGSRSGSSIPCRSTSGPLSDPLEKKSMNKRCK